MRRRPPLFPTPCQSVSARAPCYITLCAPSETRGLDRTHGKWTIAAPTSVFVSQHTHQCFLARLLVHEHQRPSTVPLARVLPAQGQSRAQYGWGDNVRTGTGLALDGTHWHVPQHLLWGRACGTNRGKSVAREGRCALVSSHDWGYPLLQLCTRVPMPTIWCEHDAPNIRGGLMHGPPRAPFQPDALPNTSTGTNQLKKGGILYTTTTPPPLPPPAPPPRVHASCVRRCCCRDSYCRLQTAHPRMEGHPKP